MRKGGEMKIEPKLIGKHPEEETYIISMDGTINPHSPCKVARSNPKGLYGPVILGSILSRMQCKRIRNNKILLETLLNYPAYTTRKKHHWFFTSLTTWKSGWTQISRSWATSFENSYMLIIYDEVIEPPSNMKLPTKSIN